MGVQSYFVCHAHQGVAPCTAPQRSHAADPIRTTQRAAARPLWPNPAAAAKPKLYNPRHPERSLLYQTIAEHFETWHALASAGQFDGQGDHHTPRTYVRQAFRKYLECGIFAHGFARARCGDCGHDYFVAFSTMRRVLHEGQTPRPLQEKATK